MESIDALLKKAQKYLQSAAVLLELEDFDSCASRAYFAMFFAAQARLLKDGLSANSSLGVRSAFINAYVETGTVPERARKALDQGAALQEIADYSHAFAVGRSEAEWVLQEGEAFVNSMARAILPPVLEG